MTFTGPYAQNSGNKCHSCEAIYWKFNSVLCLQLFQTLSTYFLQNEISADHNQASNNPVEKTVLMIVGRQQGRFPSSYKITTSGCVKLPSIHPPKPNPSIWLLKSFWDHRTNPSERDRREKLASKSPNSVWNCFSFHSSDQKHNDRKTVNRGPAHLNKNSFVQSPFPMSQVFVVLHPSPATDWPNMGHFSCYLTRVCYAMPFFGQLLNWQLDFLQ